MKNPKLDVPIGGGHVVKEFDIVDDMGKTHVRICDDSCVKTPEEVQEILYRIGDIYRNARLVQAIKDGKTA
ncbi:MAG: hypothetical protein ABF904_13135 [Ethanoligenens sp.]